MTTTRLGALGSGAVLLDDDGTLAGNSDSRIATQKAVQTGLNTRLTPSGLYAVYKQIQRHNMRLPASTVTGAADYGATGGGNVATGSNGGGQFAPVYLDPADGQLGVTSYTCKLRLIATCAVNDTAPGVTFVAGLYPIGAPTGTSGNFSLNLGAVVSGSTITFTTPAANSHPAETVTADFTCPAAGWYIVGVNASGAMAAASVALIPYHLEYRNV